ncbi:MAG: tetratricopeptide repeat protein [Candidatus Hodarchaeales archaeon]
MKRSDYTEQFKAKAATYIKNGKYKEALYYLKKLDPDIGVQTLKSSCYIATKKYDKAERILLRIVKKKPRDYEILRNLVAVSFYKGKFARELHYLEKLLAVVKKKDALELISEMTAYHGIEYYLKGEKEKAVKLFDYSLKANPKNEVSLYNLYVIANEREDYISAEKYLIQLSSVNKKHVDAIIALGGVYFKQKKYKEAIRSIKKGMKHITDDKDRFYAFTLIAKACFNIKDYKNAEKWFTKSWELNKDDAEVIGLILLTWSKLYEENKEERYAVNILEFLMLKDDREEAKKFLNRALEDFPDNKKLKNYRKVLYSNDNRT